MEITNEEELESTYRTIVKMLDLRDKCAVEPVWAEELRVSVVDGIIAQRRKMERDLAEYIQRRMEAENLARAEKTFK